MNAGTNLDIDATVTAGGSVDLDSTNGTVDVAAGARVIGGGNGTTLAINSAGGAITLNAGTNDAETVTNTGTGTITIVSNGTNNITLKDNSISAGQGLITLTAGGNLAVDSAAEAQVQIDSDGGLTISAAGVGGGGVLDINGDGLGNDTLTVTNTSTAGVKVGMTVVTDQFSAITINQADADSEVDIAFSYSGDSIDINGEDPTVTLNAIVLSNSAISLDFDLTEASKNVVVESVATGAGTLTVESSNDLTVNTGGITSTGNILLEADNDITLGDEAGTAITAQGGANVTIYADKNGDGATGGKIIDGGGVIALATTDSDVLLRAGDGIGTNAAKIETTGLD